MRAMVLGALLLAGCGDDLMPGWEMTRGPNQTAADFCTGEANRRQVVDQNCACGNWETVYRECLSRFVGSAAPSDAGTSD